MKTVSELRTTPRIVAFLIVAVLFTWVMTLANHQSLTKLAADPARYLAHKRAFYAESFSQQLWAGIAACAILILPYEGLVYLLRRVRSSGRSPSMATEPF